MNARHTSTSFSRPSAGWSPANLESRESDEIEPPPAPDAQHRLFVSVPAATTASVTAAACRSADARGHPSFPAPSCGKTPARSGTCATSRAPRFTRAFAARRCTRKILPRRKSAGNRLVTRLNTVVLPAPSGRSEPRCLPPGTANDRSATARRRPKLLARPIASSAVRAHRRRRPSAEAPAPPNSPSGNIEVTPATRLFGQCFIDGRTG